VAIVTGASSGAGRAIVLALANEGADLALLGRSMDLLQGLAHHCNERGSDSVLCVHVDLLSEESTQQAKKKVEAVFDGADILVHSAGMIMQGHVATAPLNDFNLQHRCNVMAPLLLTQLFLLPNAALARHLYFFWGSGPHNSRAARPRAAWL
jgi:3-oxoacyl-[acyl-carrier protein] reductase